MAAEKGYEVLGTQNTVYVDKSGQAVNGYAVRVLLVLFDEVHVVNVPSLDKATVKAALDKELADREALSELG